MPERSPLCGKRVLITRSHRQSSKMAELLRGRGAEPLLFPTIETVRTCNEEEKHKAVEDLDGYDWIVFTSTNGIKFFMEVCREGGRKSLPEGIKVFAVGSKTAALLNEYGISTESLPREFRAEGLLDLLKEKSPEGNRVLIPRARKGRNVLPDGLKDVGADVTVLPVYETVKPSPPESGPLPADLDVLTFTSPSTFHNFRDLAGERFRTMMGSCVVAVIGPVTGDTVRKAGWEPHVQCETYTVEKMIGELENYFTGR